MNFIVKQALGGVTGDIEKLTATKEVDPEEEERQRKAKEETQEAIQEQINERKKKHAKFEAKRESVRNDIRNKYRPVVILGWNFLVQEINRKFLIL